MNRSIIIFEKDDYTYTLISTRLSYYCPDSYIIRGTHDPLSLHQITVSDHVSVLYDDSQYSKEKVIEICDDLGIAVNGVFALCISSMPGIIDCKALASLLNNSAASRVNIKDEDKKRGKMILLLPFAYMDEREALIKDSFKKDNQESGNVCIRIDLMSGIRMMFPSIGSLTKILDKARDDDLKASDIVENAAYDDNGFLTLGRPERSDDVFDHGTECILKLLKSARQLTSDSSYPADILVVAEGLTFADMSKIAALADEVHILLPERMYKEDLGFRREIGSITQVLDPSIPVMIRYCEDKERKPSYETVRI